MAPPLYRPSPPPATDEQELRRALDQRPRWVKVIWATPGARLLLSAGFLSVAAWILVSALTDTDEFFDHRRSAGGFIFAPMIVVLFGSQAVQAISDLVHKRNSVPVFHRLGWWLDRRGLPLVGLYLVVMVALLVALID